MSLTGLANVAESLMDPVAPDAAMKLLTAIETGQRDVMESLESKIPRIANTACDPTRPGLTPLLAAAQMGCAYVLSRVYKEDAQNALDADGLDALMVAAKHGHAVAIKALWNHGLNPKATHGASNLLGFKSGGMTALMFAAEGGHADCVKDLIAAGSRLDARGPLNRTPYMMAAAAGCSESMEHLFNPKHARQVDSNGDTALMLAVKAGCEPAVQRLAEAASFHPGVDEALRLPNPQGLTPLMMAARLGDAPCAKRLASRGGVNLASNNGSTPLIFAARGGHTEVAIELLHMLADTEAKDSELGLTASGHALAAGHAPLASIIDSVAQARRLIQPAWDKIRRRPSMEFEAFVNRTRNGDNRRANELFFEHKKDAARSEEPFRAQRDWHGDTALMVAATHGNLDVLNMLLADQPIMPIASMGADGREFIAPGESVEETAKLLANKERWAALPQNAPLDIEARDARGHSALMRAAEAGHAPCVAALLAAGADPAQVDLNGYTALMAAAARGHIDCVAMLAAVAPASLRNHAGATALMLAAANEHPDCASFLASAEACAERDLKGDSALMFAAARGSAQCVDILAPLSDPSAVNHDNASALHRAASAGHGECVAILVGHNDPDALAGDGMTPLMAALLSCNQDKYAACAKILLEASDPSVLCARGRERDGRRRPEGLDAEDFARNMYNAALADLISQAKKKRGAGALLPEDPWDDPEGVGKDRRAGEGARLAARAREKLSAMSALAKKQAAALLNAAPRPRRSRSARRRA